MESVAIAENGKTYNPELDVWADEASRTFIRNEFDSSDIVWIDISTDYWTIETIPYCQFDWRNLSLSPRIESGFKRYLRTKLRRTAPTYIQSSWYALKNYASLLDTSKKSFADLQIDTFIYLWREMPPEYVSWFRQAYSWLTINGEPGTSAAIAQKLKGMKPRRKRRLLEDVLNWHPTKGALTRNEEALLREAIEIPFKNSCDRKKWGISLYCWLLIATLKRSKQLLEMRKDCMKIIETNGVMEYFALIKPVKAQTGDPVRWWPIPKALYLEMTRYSTEQSVAKLQNKYDRFWVIDETSLAKYGVSIPQSVNKSLINYVAWSLKIISPRTLKPLHVTPTRIRHTGGTRLAYAGVPRDFISEILEHDDPGSCNAYIDAVGSELCPSIDRADRNMGSLFSQLDQAYFHGKVIDKLIDQPIVVPDFSGPNALFVGSCALDTCADGHCRKHPFIGCYNGCPDFLAWREADHQRALEFADKELNRWQTASNHKDQAATIQEYKDLKLNIMRVIARIEEPKETSR